MWRAWWKCGWESCRSRFWHMGCIRGSLRLPVCPCSSFFHFSKLRVSWSEIENERLRQIRLHERVNDLPDPNYSTLKYFLGHLHRYNSPRYHYVRRHWPLAIHRINLHALKNQMSMQNLAIVLGPTLFGQPMPSAPGAITSPMPDTHHQNLVGFSWFNCGVTWIAYRIFCQAIETILNHYVDIFVDETEGSWSRTVFVLHQIGGSGLEFGIHGLDFPSTCCPVQSPFLVIFLLTLLGYTHSSLLLRFWFGSTIDTVLPTLFFLSLLACFPSQVAVQEAQATWLHVFFPFSWCDVSSGGLGHHLFYIGWKKSFYFSSISCFRWWTDGCTYFFFGVHFSTSFALLCCDYFF